MKTCVIEFIHGCQLPSNYSVVGSILSTSPHHCLGLGQARQQLYNGIYLGGYVTCMWKYLVQCAATVNLVNILPARLPACLPACLHTCLPACLLTCLLACLLACMPACLHACFLTCLPAYLLACLLDAYLLTCLLACLLELSRTHFQCSFE